MTIEPVPGTRPANEIELNAVLRRAYSFAKKGDITRPDYVMYVWKKGQDGKIDYSGNEIGM